MLLSPTFYSIVVLFLASFTSARVNPAPRPGTTSTLYDKRPSPTQTAGFTYMEAISTGGAGVATVADYQQAYNQGYRYVAVRGYKEKWSNAQGGTVDPDFLGNVANGLNASFVNFDATWFPCSGTTHTCKSYTTQITELVEYINKFGIPILRIFLQIDVDDDSKNWDYGASENFAQAQAMLAALQTATTKYSLTPGIMSSYGAWETIFGKLSVEVDTSGTIPLWNVQWDNSYSNSLSTFYTKPKYGGWEIAVGKQYALSAPSISKIFSPNLLILPK